MDHVSCPDHARIFHDEMLKRGLEPGNDIDTFKILNTVPLLFFLNDPASTLSPIPISFVTIKSCRDSS